MAEIGKNAAYQQLRAPQDNISGDIFYWNEDGYRRRQEERIAENQQAARDEQKRRAREERVSKYSKALQNYDTGSSSLNELQGRGLAEAMNMIGDIAVQLENPDLSIEEQVKLQTKLNNLQKTPETFKAFTEAITERNAAIQTAYENGEVVDNEKYQNFKKAFEGGFSGMQIGFDPDTGAPVVAYRDKDGDGILDFESYDQISKGISAFTVDKKYNMDAQAKAIAGELQTITNTTDSGFVKNTVKGFDPEAVDLRANKSIRNEDGSLTPQGKYYLDSLGLEDTVENREEAVNRFKELILSFEPRSNVTDVDYGARNAANRIAQANRKDDNDTTPVNSEGVDISESTWGGEYFDNIDRENVVSKSGGGTVLEAPKDSDGNVYNDAKVLNYTVDREGNLLLDIEYTDQNKEVTKSSGRQNRAEVTNTTTKEDTIRRKVIKVSAEDAREFASKRGTTISELKKSVKKEGGSNTQQPDQNNDPLGLGI